MKVSDHEVKIFKALAHPIRLKLVKKLMQDSHCVCDLNENIAFSQSAISQHLRILSEAGVVVKEKQGLKVMYSLSCGCIASLVDSVENLEKHWECQKQVSEIQVGDFNAMVK